VNLGRPSDLRNLRSIAVALLVFAASGTLVVVQARWAAARLPRAEPLAELSYYPSGTWLSEAAMGDATSWSDLMWLRAVQYYGLHRETDNTFLQMAHVFDVITTLDPRFQNAYVFGGTSLCQEGHQFDAGVKLLEKGLRNNPTAWIYPFELGFVHYLGKRNLTRATFDFAQAARQPNAPDYCERFAAWSGQRAGYEAVAVELWRQVAETTDNAILRDKAIEHLRELIHGTGEEHQLEAWIGSLKPLLGEVPQAKLPPSGGGGS
jgi:tetratricopeptide (TPR) repeat protein